MVNCCLLGGFTTWVLSASGGRAAGGMLQPSAHQSAASDSRSAGSDHRRRIRHAPVGGSAVLHLEDLNPAYSVHGSPWPLTDRPRLANCSLPSSFTHLLM